MNMARLLLLAQLLLLISVLPAAKGKSIYAVHSCIKTSSYGPNSAYGSDLRTLLDSIFKPSSSYHFNSASMNNLEKIEALYQCRSDISIDECKFCVSNATSDVLKRCPTQKTAVIWYDKCVLRFSNEPIFAVLSTSPTWYLTNTINSPLFERARFNAFVRNDLNECATVAANSPSKFAVKESNTHYEFTITTRIYTLAQCTEDLSKDDCSQCLDEALNEFPGCCTSTVGARVLKPSCNFRFELYPYYNASGVPSTS